MEKEKEPGFSFRPLEVLNRNMSIDTDVVMEIESFPIEKPDKIIQNSKRFILISIEFFEIESISKVENGKISVQNAYIKIYGEDLLKNYLMKEKEFEKPLKTHCIDTHIRSRISKWLLTV